MQVSESAVDDFLDKELGVSSQEWAAFLEQERMKNYYRALLEVLTEEYRSETIFPAKRDIFRALQLTPYQDVKVVILGQDPYHGFRQSHGLSFSVLPGVKLPPSLRNIYKELQEDIGCPVPSHGCLEHWAKQGVLLLNSVLTVREGQPNSHRKLGWEVFTDALIRLLNERAAPMAFVLWGKQAQNKGRYIDQSKHLVLNSVHPSPLSAFAGFWGSKPFSQCNTFLEQNGISKIDWAIPELDT